MKLLTSFLLCAAMLSAQSATPPIYDRPAPPAHKSHKRLWIEIAVVAAAIGATVLIQRRMDNNRHEARLPKPKPISQFIPSPISGVNPSVKGFFTPAQLFQDPKSPYFIPKYGEACWMVLIEKKTCGPSWINP